MPARRGAFHDSNLHGKNSHGADAHADGMHMGTQIREAKKRIQVNS